jgi:surfactin synthase thioesterase subunit
MSTYVDERPSPAALRVFCFHHAGGGASFYRGWQRALGPHVSVLPVLLPGRERREGQPRFTELPALVADLDAALGELLAEPHVFFGHSMGALLAYRLACHRRAAGAAMPRALLLSAYPAPHLPPPLPADHGDALARLLTGLGGLPPDVPGLADLLAVTRDDLRLCADHHDAGEPPLACPVHVFGGDGDPLVAEDDLRAWQQHTSRPIELWMLRGDHFYLRDDPDPLLHHLRSLLRRYLRG